MAPSDRDLAQQCDWQKWLRPGDEQYTRSVDPLTGYLNLRMVTALRSLVAGLFPDLAPAAQHQDHTEREGS